MKKNPYRNLVLISQLSIQMMVPIFLCLFAGMFLDKQFSAGFFTIIFLVLGILAGGRNAYILAMNSIDSEKKQEEKRTYEEYK